MWRRAVFANRFLSALFVQKIGCMEKKAKKEKNKKVPKEPAKAKVIGGETKPGKKPSDVKTGKCRSALRKW